MIDISPVRAPARPLRRLADLTLTLAAVAGALSLLAALVFAAVGIKPLVFTSGSMSPQIPTGSLALARAVPVHELAVGDVVSVLDAAGTRVTHRVAAIEDGGLVLKGDANLTVDADPYDVDAADRVLVSVPYAGRVLAAVTGDTGRALLLGLGAVVVIALLVPRRGIGRREGVAVLAALAVVLGVGVGVSRPAEGTSAYWTDSVDGSSTLATVDLQAPGKFQCTDRGLFYNAVLSWNPVPIATGYKLEVRRANGTVARTVEGLSGTSVILDMTNLQNFTSGYTVTLYAVRSVGSATVTSAAAGPIDINTLLFTHC